FRYLFSYACRAADAHVYQVFLSSRPAERVRKIAEGFSWYALKAVLGGAHNGVDAADFRDMYVEGFLSGFDPPEPVFSAERFGGTPRLANLLLKLIREEKKTATSSLRWSYRSEDSTPPAAGEITVVLDGNGMPGAVIRTTSITELPFSKVSAEMARLEGEDDLSLEAWRKGHWKWFSKECRGIGKDPDESMPVIFEEFELLEKL
ncbi:MAG: ASCH domain-containing protein, partial [Spirochaetota bacterium]